MYKFNRYTEEDLVVILPRSTTVQVCGMWGYDNRSPGPMFDVEIKLDNPATVLEASDMLAAEYAELCEMRGWTPREAYGYEGIRRLPGYKVQILLGT